MSALDSIEWGLRNAALTVVPEPYLELIRAYRRSGAFRKAGVVYVHVPKTAGTSIAQALYGRFIGHFKVSDIVAVSPRDVVALPRFSVTRDPWDRLVSAWSFARTWHERVRPGQVTTREPQNQPSPSAAEFRTFVHETLATQSVDGLTTGVFRPQHAYLTDAKGSLAFDHVGRVESLALTEEWLSDILRRDIRFDRLNTTLHHSYDSYYDARTRQLVGELYEADVRLFGY